MAGERQVIGEDTWDPDAIDDSTDIVEVELPVSKQDEPEEEVEVVADPGVSEKDAKATPVNENPEPTDEELGQYSEGVRKRIGLLKHGYHDERRAREAALRERDEAIRYAQAIQEKYSKLAKEAETAQAAGIDAAIVAVKRKLKDATDAYNAEQMTDAQAELADLMAQKRFFGVRSAESLAPIQQPVVQTRASEVTQPSAPDTRAQKWAAQNDSWFQRDRAMTGYALGVDAELKEEGIDPNREPDRYYELLDKRIRAKFPEKFGSKSTEAAPSETRRPSSPVASANRAAAPRKKITLTQSQVRMAEALGLTPQQYYREVQMIEQEQRNG